MTFNVYRTMRQSGELQSVSAISYKENMKKHHDLKFEKRKFMVGDLELLYNYRLRLFPGKLKSKWTSHYLITQVFPHKAVELKAKEEVGFKMNRERIKIYFGHKPSGNEVIEAYHLDEV